jgi:hypothetical protein
MPQPVLCVSATTPSTFEIGQRIVAAEGVFLEDVGD